MPSIWSATILLSRAFCLSFAPPSGLALHASRSRSARFLLPSVEGLFADQVLPAEGLHARAGVGFPQNADLLFGGVAFSFHRLGPFYQASDSHSNRTNFSQLDHGERQGSFRAIADENRKIWRLSQ